MGGLRRLARQSFLTVQNPPSTAFPTLTDNWTVQQTATYDANDPADSPAAWGGTVANLDRELTATGGGHTTRGVLLTFVNKPEGNSLGQPGSFGGVIVKVQPTFTAGTAPPIEVWSLVGSTWTKRRRVSIAGVARNGETVVIDLTGPILPTTQVDAYWITMAPVNVGDTMSWLAMHVYGICLTDPVTPDCPPGTEPEDCDGPECGVDIETWLCLDPPEEPTAPPDPFVLPPILVGVPMPAGTFVPNIGYTFDCPRPNTIEMLFGDLPSGGSVTVAVANPQGVTFVEGAQQTISAAGTMTWTVQSGYQYANFPNNVALPPSQVAPELTFFFTRQLDGSAFAVAGNLLDILQYFWTFNLAYNEVC